MRYKIIHGFRLHSSDTLLQPGQLFTTDDKDVQKELEPFVEHGACEVAVPPSQETAYEVVVDPNDDITTVKGVGAATLEKLNEAGIATRGQLKAAMLEPAKEEQMKEILGANYAKVLAQFQA
jgi:predicted flap endonuclease-1-like 5' DNA nuclease